MDDIIVYDWIYVIFQFNTGVKLKMGSVELLL
jgi:hypothetical protein